MRSKVISILSLTLLGTVIFAEDVLTQDRRPFADGLMARSMYRLALPEYLALSKQNPKPDELDIILARLAECQYQTKDYKGAVATCERLTKEFPNSKFRSQGTLTHALALGGLGDDRNAALLYDNIATDPDAPFELRIKAFFFGGEIRFRLKEYGAAQSRFSNLIKITSGKVVDAASKDLLAFASLYLADIKSRENTPAAVNEALRQYDAIAAAAPAARIAAEALFKSAALAYTNGKFKDAESRFTLLRTRYPDDLRVNDSLLPAAWTALKLEKFPDADILAQKARSLPAQSRDHTAESIYLTAKANAGLNNADKAIKAYDQLISFYPESDLASGVKYDLIVLLYDTRQYERLLKEAAAFSHTSDELMSTVLWLQSESAEKLNDKAAAANFCKTIVDKYPKSNYASRASYRYATYLREINRPAAAAEEYMRCAMLFSKHKLVPYALYNAALSFFEAGDYAQSVKALNDLLKDFPDNELVPEALLRKSLSHYALEETEKAAETLSSLIAKSGVDSNILNSARLQLGRIYYDGEKFADAENTLRPVLSASPVPSVHEETLFLLGITLLAQDKGAEAAKMLQPLLSKDFSHKISPERLVWLLDFQYSQQRYKEAIEAGEVLVKRNLTPAVTQSVNVILGRSYLAGAMTNEAAAAFQKAADSVVVTRYSAEAALQLGEILIAENRNLDDAKKYLTKAIQQSNSADLESIRARAYFAFASAHEQIGNLTEAIRGYQAVSLLFNDNTYVPQALKKAVALLSATRQNEEAAMLQRELDERFPSKRD